MEKCGGYIKLKVRYMSQVSHRLAAQGTCTAERQVVSICARPAERSPGTRSKRKRMRSLQFLCGSSL